MREVSRFYNCVLQRWLLTQIASGYSTRWCSLFRYADDAVLYVRNSASLEKRCWELMSQLLGGVLHRLVSSGPSLVPLT